MLNEMKSRPAGANRIEVFTAGCNFCNSAVDLVKSSISEDDELIVYNMNERNKKATYKKIADGYGINSVPAVTVNGKLLSCCKSSGISKEELLSRLN